MSFGLAKKQKDKGNNRNNKAAKNITALGLEADVMKPWKKSVLSNCFPLSFCMDNGFAVLMVLRPCQIR